MSSASAAIDLPGEVVEWIERSMQGAVIAARPHFSGASRLAWTIDVTREAEAIRLFLLRDKGSGGGSTRDAAVLRALAGRAVPVPRVLAVDAQRGMLLLERLPGVSDFPVEGDDAGNEATAKHLMQLCAALHAIDPGTLDVSHLEAASEEGCAAAALAQARGAVDATSGDLEPFFPFALRWLEGHLPPEAPRKALVHSDMGPGNFLHQGGRVTGIVDWEVAHPGDPMEDLAALAVRDMATPVGSLAKRFREYEEAGGAPVSLERVHYYRLLLLVRNSAMIGLGLAHPVEGFDVVEMTMYQTLLLRAATLVLCDAIGCERPTPAQALGALERARADSSSSRGGLLDALQRDVERVILPALPDGTARRRAEGLARGLAALEHEERWGGALDLLEHEDRARLLERGEAASAREADAPDRVLRERALEALEEGEAVAAWATYFARRMHRLAERRRPLMGLLLDRLPQELGTS